MFEVNNKNTRFMLLLHSYIFLVNLELFLVELRQVLIWWILIINYQFISVLHDVKQNLILDFSKSHLKLELFLIDPIPAII